MKFKFWALFIVLAFLPAVLAFGQDRPLEEFSEQYKEDVRNFKMGTDQFFEDLQKELDNKNAPHAYFIKNLQEQIGSNSFSSAGDFESTAEMLKNLEGSLNYPASKNPKFKKTLKEGQELLLGRLNVLKEEFKGARIAPSASIANNGSRFKASSFTTDKIKESASLVFKLILAGASMIFISASHAIQSFSTIVIVFLAMSSLYFAFRAMRYAQENKKLLKKDWSNLIKVKTKKSIQTTYDGLESIYICQVDKSDKIIFCNKSFEQIFGRPLNLSKFLEERFKSDKDLRGVANVSKYLGDITNDYFINVGPRDEFGLKTVFIHRFDSTLLSKIATTRSACLERNKVNTTDLLESSLSKVNSFKVGSNIVLAESDYADSYFVYIQETQAQELFDYYVRAVSAISRLKACSGDVEIKSQRAEKMFHLCAFFPHINLKSKDMAQSVPFAGKTMELGEIIKGIKDVIKGHEVNLLIKNIESSDRSGVHFELVISDLEKVNVGAFEYSL